MAAPRERGGMSKLKTGPAATVWDRVLCAIDQTPASIHAARTAARLMPAAASLTLCTVVHGEALGADVSLERSRTREAQDALTHAQAETQPFHDAELHLREGRPVRRLLDELSAERATLVTVARHGDSGAVGATLGELVTAILHEAVCSVLIAGAAERDHGEVVVGFDGSGGAGRALAVGRELSARLALVLRVLVATGEPHPPGPGWSGHELGTELDVIEDPRTAVEALIEASHSARLLILGSRHLGGVMARSSVSEQAARGADCPVLVIR